jgi:glycosyltransferase involved in cell wall biosynthesis
VHTHTSKAGAVGRLAGLLYRFATPRVLFGRPRACRFVHTYHGHVFHGYFGTWKTRHFLTIDRVLARLNTDRLIVLGQQQLHEIHDTFGIGRSDQFAIIPIGIDLSMLPRDPPEPVHPTAVSAANGQRVTAGIVARLSPIKNHDLFLRMAAKSQHCPRFVIYGDGPLRAGLEATARQLGVQTRVTFAGVQTAEEIYRAVDIVVLTSRNEGTPQALIEALGAGKAVLSTAVGGVVDLLGAVEERVTRNGSSFEIRQRGLTARSDDPGGLAEALDRLATDVELRARLAARGRAYVFDVHGRERLLTNVTELYRTVTSPPLHS